MPGEGLTHGPRAIKKHGEGTTGAAESSGIPCAMGYGLYVVSPVTGLSCHRHSRSSRELSLSVGRPEPYDFAVRISAVRPHDKSCASPMRPSHPASRVVTIAHTPLLPRRDARIMLLIWGRSQDCFRKSAQTSCDMTGILRMARMQELPVVQKPAAFPKSSRPRS